MFDAIEIQLTLVIFAWFFCRMNAGIMSLCANLQHRTRKKNIENSEQCNRNEGIQIFMTVACFGYNKRIHVFYYNH